MTDTPVLSVTDLRVDFQVGPRTVHAVRGISFDVQRNSILGIVGGSGSGKTVACRSLMRLLPDNATIPTGRVDFEGIDMLGVSERELDAVRGERIAMIFQNPSTHLDPIMPVGQQIGETLIKHRAMSVADARREAIALLDEMSIPNPDKNVDAYPHELSGGMRQRVMIAAALACQPDVLMADEPTTALDVTVQAQILALLKRLRRERNLTIVMVSHDLGVIAEMCDRMIVMREGEVVEKGAVDAVIGRPKQDYTKRLIDSQPTFLAEAREREAAASAPAEPAAQREPAPYLAVENAEISYGRNTGLLTKLLRWSPGGYKAVDGVSFDVGQDQTLGIVGESGSGKSTVAKAIAGLLPLSGGKIAFKGQTLEGLRRDALMAHRRKVQMVFQDPYSSLNPLFTVAQTLAEPMRIHRLCPLSEIDARIDDLMRRVEIEPELRDRRPSQLSGGQRQRICIARSLALEPELLIADEVTSALDVTVQAQIIGLFERLHHELGLSLVLISHDLGVVRCLCQRVVVMKSGQIVETGSTRQVFEDPQHPYTQELISSIPHVARSN